jgi:Leucine-rich repeat (LRR) protein
MFYSLELNDNPLQELPPSLASSANSFVWLDLQSTNINSLPAWTLTQVLGIIYMFETPYCSNTSPEMVQRNVLCYPRSATYPGVEVPLDLLSQIYAYERD